MFQMAFEGDIFDEEDFKFKVKFSTDIREQLARKGESEVEFNLRIEKLSDDKIKSDLAFIVNFDSHIYNFISDIIDSEINDYADKNNLDFHEYENFECKNRTFTFAINGRTFVFEK